MKRILALTLALALPFAFAGCAEEEEDEFDPQASQDKVDLGVFAAFEAFNSEEQDFTGAYDLFEEAVRLDPNNMTAHAGAGAMNILRMPHHPVIAALFDSLGVDDILTKSEPWRTLGGGKGPSPAAGASRVILGGLSGDLSTQTDFDGIIDLVLGQIQLSIDHFDVVEAHSDFQWLIPLPAGVGPDTLEIDVADIHLAESSLHFIEAFLLGLKAYEMEVESLDETGLVNALSQGSDFLTLTDPASMAAAGTAIGVGADEMHNGAVRLEAETDDQTDDLIRLLLPGEEFGEWPALSQGQLDTLEAMPTLMDELMGTAQMVADDFNGDDEPDTVMVTLGVLFDDPIQDWKAIVPNYTIAPCTTEYDTSFALLWEATTIDQWMWHPDSLHGLIALPDGPMTSEDMRGIFDLDSLYTEAGCE